MAEGAPPGSEETEVKHVSQEAARCHFSWEASPSDACPVTRSSPLPRHNPSFLPASAPPRFSCKAWWARAVTPSGWLLGAESAPVQ